MAALPAFAMVHSLDQWRRVTHDATALQKSGEDVGLLMLSWKIDEPTGHEDAAAPPRAGLAFDPWCRLYRAVPEKGQVERFLWDANRSLEADAVDLFEPQSERFGDFSPAVSGDAEAGPLQLPVDIVVDKQGRLFVAEAGRYRVLSYDLVESRLLQEVVLEAPPLKLATDGERVWVLTGGATPQLIRLEGRAEPRTVDIPAEIVRPTSLTVGQGRPYLLDRGGDVDAAIVPLDAPADAFNVEFASEILFASDSTLVVARRAAEDFLRFEISSNAVSGMPHLKAPHYDGRGIALTPDDQVVYWSEKGLRRATLARVRYCTEGKVATFQLDSGEYQTQWGRVFVDACIPRGTRVSMRCLCLDEVPETAPPLTWVPPENAVDLTLEHFGDTPPLPPEILLNAVSTSQSFYRRSNGRERPWQPCPGDTELQTYEAPVIAPAGRYLWIELTLHGTARLTPKIRSLRAEYSSHDLMRRLPQVYSRDTAVADFLRRYLAISEGELRDLDIRATFRHLLLDPNAAPGEVLPWLGEMLGMTLDRRWPEEARRKLIENAIWLFRYRGTVMGLKRFIEIYLDSEVTILEHFKVRGLGGAFLGEDDALASNSVLGAGFRIGGRLGTTTIESINDISIQDAITTHAHRFSLIIATSLNEEQESVIEYLLETHRPAHTLYDVCTVDDGMHVGLGLHAGLTSIVGETSGFGELQLGASVLGRNDTLGRAKIGTSIGASQLGNDTRVG